MSVKVYLEHGYGASSRDVEEVLGGHLLGSKEDSDLTIVVDRPLGYVSSCTLASSKPVIFLTWNRCPVYKLNLLDLRPNGLLEGRYLTNLPYVIEAVMEGEQVVPLIITPLTSKERTVLKLVARGYSNKTIADMTNVGEQTIKNHIYSFYEKLHLKSRVQAAHYYFGNWHLIEGWRPPEVLRSMLQPSTD